MAISYINSNTATIGDLFISVNDTIEQVNILLQGEEALLTNADTLGGHVPSYYAQSSRTISGDDLITGSGTLASNTVLTVTGASAANVAKGTVTNVAVTPDSLRMTPISLPAANTMAIGTANSAWVNIFGNTTIASFGPAPVGVMRYGQFSNTIIVQHNNSYIRIPGATNYTTTIGDRYEAISLGSGVWSICWIGRVSGKSMIAPSWSDITSKPTTITGYGITDAASLTANNQIVSGGSVVSPRALPTGSVTLNSGSGPLQYITNNGAFTITAPANDGSLVLLVTNGASAGTITFSGFTVGSNVGDTLTTTNGHKFMISVIRIYGTTSYHVKALQ